MHTVFSSKAREKQDPALIQDSPPILTISILTILSSPVDTQERLLSVPSDTGPVPPHLSLKLQHATGISYIHVSLCHVGLTRIVRLQQWED
jgi:hypothetical protein